MRYNIENLIEKSCKDKSLFDIITDISSELNIISNIKNLKKHSEDLGVSEYQIKRYENLAGGFLFFLNTGIKPGSVSNSDFQAFKPVVIALVERGDLKQDALSVFE